MIKKIEDFKNQEAKAMYTPEEFEAVYDIVAEYYDGDDIEDYIYSTDVEEKEEFIEENGIETLRVCQCCGKFINEGYIYEGFETFCSEECFVETNGKSIFNNADDDELYWTAW